MNAKDMTTLFPFKKSRSQEAITVAHKTTFSPHSNVHMAILNWIVKDSCSLMNLQQK